MMSKKNIPSRYQIVNQSFRFALDGGWQDESNIRFSGPLCDGLLHYITISIDRNVAELAVDNYALAYLQSLQATLPEFVMVKQGQLTMFDKKSAYEIVYQWQANPEKKLIQRSMFVIKQEKMHILSTSFTLNSWGILHKTIDNMMRSFH